MKRGTKLELSREWTIGAEIGAGGFGRVYSVTDNGEEAVAKLVPKDPGADRELLFVNLDGVRNIVPIVDYGDTSEYWVLVMPRADKSLRQHLDEAERPDLDLQVAVSVLIDIATALTDLDGKVVHRDLKPENVLFLEGSWCLADFGISRYAEATTGLDTQKFSLSPPYAAPERWRSEHASSAADVYSLGVIAYEMLAGSRPFPGPGVEDYRDQHLHSDPPELSGVPSLLIALVEECLYKAAGARPTPANVARRLEGVGSMPKSEGLARLQEANSQEVLRRAESSRQESESRSVAEMRQELADSAGRTFMRIGDALRGAILSSAPSTAPEPTRSRGWALRLNRASLALSAQVQTSANPWHWEAPSLDVVCHADLTLTIPEDHYQYAGRSHSLWFCDAQAADEYAWYETAFMLSPLIPRRARRDPFALEPGEEAAKALLMGMAEYQVAWPFTRLSVGEVDEFIDRWAGWFADAADGALTHPSTMPERQPQGSWRTS